MLRARPSVPRHLARRRSDRRDLLVPRTCALTDVPTVDSSIHFVGVPFTRIAHDMETARVKNVVALDALQAATRLMEPESLLAALGQSLHDDWAMWELNRIAFRTGVQAVKRNS